MKNNYLVHIHIVSVPLDNYFWHMKQVTTFLLENPEVPVLTLSFEDMKKVGQSIVNHHHHQAKNIQFQKNC